MESADSLAEKAVEAISEGDETGWSRYVGELVQVLGPCGNPKRYLTRAGVVEAFLMRAHEADTQGDSEAAERFRCRAAHYRSVKFSLSTEQRLRNLAIPVPAAA